MKTLKRYLKHNHIVDVVKEGKKYKFFLDGGEVNLHTLVHKLNLPFTGEINIENVISSLKNKGIKTIPNTPVIFHGGY